MRRLLADPRVRLFYLGTIVSTLGDYALYLALGVWVRLLTGSTGLAGLTFLALIAGASFSPLTGVLVDRLPRRPLMIATYLATAALLMCLLAVSDRHQVWLIYAVAFAYGLSGAITGNAQQALVQQMVPQDLLSTANGLQQTATQGMRLITPLVGVGLLAWLGGHAVAVADAVTFLIGATCLLALRLDETRPQPEPGMADGAGTAADSAGRGLRRDISAGFRYLAQTAVLRQITLAFAVAIFVLGFYETLGLQITTVGLGHAPTWVSVFVTAQGVGGLLGGITAAPVARRLGDRMLTALGLVLLAVMSAGLTAPYDTVALAAAAVGGVGLPWIIVGGMTIYQKNTPNAMIGRVMGAADLATQIPQVLGIALGAALVTVVYYRTLCLAVAVVMAGAAVYLGWSRRGTAAGVIDVPAGVVDLPVAAVDEA